jgi:hypothetical protein
MTSPGRIGLVAFAVAALIAAIYWRFRQTNDPAQTVAPAHRSASLEIPVVAPATSSTDAPASAAKSKSRNLSAGAAALARTDSAPRLVETRSSSAHQAISGIETSADVHAAADPNSAKDRPRGWRITGRDATNCTLESDHSYAQSGAASALLRSSNSGPAQWCAIIQSSAPGRYQGTRLQFSAYLSTQASAGGGSLWFRADDAQGLTVAFETQVLRPLGGNSPWTFEVIVIDVPETARAIFYGAAFRNGGLMWMDSAEFNVVDKTVPLTSRPITAQEAVVNPHLDLAALRAAPENLDFEQTEPLEQ